MKILMTTGLVTSLIFLNLNVQTLYIFLGFYNFCGALNVKSLLVILIALY